MVCQHPALVWRSFANELRTFAYELRSFTYRLQTLHWWVWDRKILVYESISIEFESCVENKGKPGHTIWYAQVMFTSIVFTSYNRCVMLGQYKKQLRNWSDFHNLIQITTKSARTHCSRVTHTSVKCIIGSFDTLILTWHHPLLRMWLFAYLALYQM